MQRVVDDSDLSDDLQPGQQVADTLNRPDTSDVGDATRDIVVAQADMAGVADMPPVSDALVADAGMASGAASTAGSAAAATPWGALSLATAGVGAVNSHNSASNNNSPASTAVPSATAAPQATQTTEASATNVNATDAAGNLVGQPVALHALDAPETGKNDAGTKLPELAFAANGVQLKIAENGATSDVIYIAHATSTEQGDVVYSLAGKDAAAFHIDPNTGAVTLLSQADYETKPLYAFDVVATDAAGNHVHQSVGVEVRDIVETSGTSMPTTVPAPSFDVSASIGQVAENSDISTAVYTAHATYTGPGAVAYSLSGADAGAFHIDAQTGIVTLLAPADFEAKSDYAFDVLATDPTGRTVTQTVALAVQDVNEAPVVGTHYEVHVTPGAAQVNFHIPADMFIDPDTTAPNNTLHYYIDRVEVPLWAQMFDDTPLMPQWLSFDEKTGTLTGTLPFNPNDPSYTVTLRVGAVDTAPPIYSQRTVHGETTYQETYLSGFSGLHVSQTLTLYMDGTTVPSTATNTVLQA
ncbi:MAG: cadherin repeat domain-containing protein [Pseudomonadota bacterium]